MKKFFLFYFLMFFLGNLFAQISVFSYRDSLPKHLIETQLAGIGVSVFNVAFNEESSIVKSSQIGSFTNSSAFSNFPFCEGIIMATGDIQVAQGPNNSDSAYCKPTGMTLKKDTALKAITSALASTSMLDFDFKTESDQISFDYIFASEEYPEYVCSGFNDVFAFFVTGPDPQNPNQIITRNIALVPGTDLPVSINTINSGNIGINCTYGNHCTYCLDSNQSLAYAKYYIENPKGSPYLQYDGYTTSLQAHLQVVPCQTYHLRLSIADVGDQKYQSALFLKKGGFSKGRISITAFSPSEKKNTLIEGGACGQLKIALSSPLSMDYPVKIKFEGTALYGIDYEPIEEDQVFKLGDSALLVDIKPLKDSLIEPNETIKIKCYADFCGQLQFLDSCIIWIEDSVLIEEKELKIPNVITPNGDGINDILVIENLNLNAENELIIYDRWGKKVYQKKNYNVRLEQDRLRGEGGFDGHNLSAGTYYYVFSYKDEKLQQIISKKGSLTIIR